MFISPESILAKGIFQNMLLSPPYIKNLVAVVVDEAHCVKTWGDDFRVAFSEIGDLGASFQTMSVFTHLLLPLQQKHITLSVEGYVWTILL